MSTQGTTLTSANSRLPTLEQTVQDLQARYSAALEMLGEKTEQVSELQADIADMKQVYRDQVQELVQLLDEHGIQRQ